jgi:hypothetical protein
VLLTEDEAKEKWCPFTRALYVADADDDDDDDELFEDQDPVHNRLVVEGVNDQGFSAGEELDQGKTCLGSRCMAWRWALRPTDGAKVGYCGLAGIPSPAGS